MIYTLDQLNGLVDVVTCPTCNCKVAVVFLNNLPNLRDKNNKPVLAKPNLELVKEIKCEGNRHYV